MPSPQTHRREHEEKNRKGKLANKSSSFHGQVSATGATQLRRPKTLPNLYSFGTPGETIFSEGRPKLTKLLLNVTIQGSLGPVQVLMPPEMTVADLVTAVVRQYSKEGRRPILQTTDPAGFDLHYSQFSLESLDRDEKLVNLGSRNFFLCRKKLVKDDGGVEVTTSSGSCSKEVEKVTKPGAFSWLKFMEFSK